VSQLKGCATVVCDSVTSDPYPVRAARLRIPGSQKLVAAGELTGGVLLATGEDETDSENNRTLFLLTEKNGAELLTALRGHFRANDRIVARGDHWSYTVAGSFNRKWGALFIAGQGAVTSPASFVELPLNGPNIWLPLEGDSPRGLYVSQGGERSVLLDVTPAGIQHRWTLNDRVEIYPRCWTAQVLSDGALAVLSIDGPLNGPRTRLMLRLFDTNELSDKPTAEYPLQGKEQFNEIASAISPTGMLAIAAETSKGIQAAVINPRDAANGIAWRQTGTAGEAPSYVRVMATADDFTVTWNEHHRSTMDLRARSITATSVELLATTVASIPHRNDDRVPFIALSHGSDVLFVWDAGDVNLRQLPRPLSGYQLFADLRAVLCRPFVDLHSAPP